MTEQFVNNTSDATANDSILNMDATTIARKIKERQMTSLDAVTAYIKHIKKVNGRLNAVVEERFATAIEEAKNKDLSIEDTAEIGELYGVPISVKEAYHVAGMKTTGGLLHRNGATAYEDADAVTKLKNSGAVILGKTNTPELCFCQETENKLYGRTNNPWDLTRTVGGSSGGEGALLAAGGAAIGIGSDIGGSIRFPSHFNGVIGFKPGMFQVSAKGHFANIDIPLQQRMLGFGPMGKSVRDMEMVYTIIAQQTPSPKSLDNFQIDIPEATSDFPLSEKSTEALNDITQFLTNHFPTKRDEPPFFEKSALLWQEIMSVDGGESVKNVALPGTNSSVLREYAKEKLAKNASIHAYLSWALIGTKMFKPSAKRISEIESIIEQGDRELNDYLTNRILIFPIYHTGALKHGKVYKEVFSIRKTFLKYMPYVAYANVWGLPSLIIPIGTDENDMPISVQLMSKNGNEDALFQLGKKLESEFRGYIRCQKLD